MDVYLTGSISELASRRSEFTALLREGGAERSYNLECTLTVENVVVPVPHGEDVWPLSGTITRQCTVTFVGGRRAGQTVTRTIVVNFNGTQNVILTVGDKVFDLDLKLRRRAARPERRGQRSVIRGQGFHSLTSDP